MANYVNSGNIEVFPSGFRGSSYSKAKLTTEDNLTSFFGKLSKNENNNRFYFILNNKKYIGIDGYIFVITGDLPQGTHAFIKLRNISNIGNVLDNIASPGQALDDGTYFKGLGFDTSVPAATGYIGFALGSGQPLRLDSDEIRNISSGTPTTGSIHDSFTTNKINNCSLATATNGFTLSHENASLEVSNAVSLDGPIDISGSIDISSLVEVAPNATVSINKAVTINSPLTIGATTTNTGEVIIKSAGSNSTTIVGKDNGIIHLPTNSDTGSTDGTYAFITVRTGGRVGTYSPSMQSIESTNASYTASTDTIVARSTTGAAAIQKIHTEKVCAYGTNTNLQFFNTASSTTPCVTMSTPSTTAIYDGTNVSGTIVVKGGIGTDKNIYSVGDIQTSGSIVSRGSLQVYSGNNTIFTVSKSSGAVTLNLGDSSATVTLNVGAHNSGNDCRFNVYGSGTTSRFAVGTTTITANLPVNASSVVTGYNFVATNTSTETGSYSFANKASSPSFYVTPSGEVTAKSYNATSDIRKKENIVEFTPAKSILGLNVKKFDYIDGPKNQIGCIAQDLKEICPEIVNEDNEGYLTIQENKLVYLLLEEVKQLRKEVNELKNK